MKCPLVPRRSVLPPCLRSRPLSSPLIHPRDRLRHYLRRNRPYALAPAGSSPSTGSLMGPAPAARRAPCTSHPPASRQARPAPRLPPPMRPGPWSRTSSPPAGRGHRAAHGALRRQGRLAARREPGRTVDPPPVHGRRKPPTSAASVHESHEGTHTEDYEYNKPLPVRHAPAADGLRQRLPIPPRAGIGLHSRGEFR